MISPAAKRDAWLRRLEQWRAYKRKQRQPVIGKTPIRASVYLRPVGLRAIALLGRDRA